MPEVTPVYMLEDMGARVPIGRMTPEEYGLYVTIVGATFDIPSCCVEAFADDVEHGCLPGLRRGRVPDPRGGYYVPCPDCCEAIGREYVC